MGDHIPVLLVTANVGSIFEEPQTLLPGWIGAFLAVSYPATFWTIRGPPGGPTYLVYLYIQTVKKNQPSFLALHCQEVGGKNYEKTMPHVADFISFVLTEWKTQKTRASVFVQGNRGEWSISNPTAALPCMLTLVAVEMIMSLLLSHLVD